MKAIQKKNAPPFHKRSPHSVAIDTYLKDPSAMLKSFVCFRQSIIIIVKQKCM